MEQQKKGNIAYLIIGIATLIVATTGATFAYYTATNGANNAFTGNMATITFDLSVQKKTTVDESMNNLTTGLIPMTNSMVQKAVNNASTKGICVDDNGNAVCQVYKIILNNTGTASMFVDGYVQLTGGSGVSTDDASATTTMRWAQAFCTETSAGVLSTCTTAGKTTTRATTTSNTAGIDTAWSALGSGTTSQHNTGEIKSAFTDVTYDKGVIQNNEYDIIDTNYIRISKNADSVYTQADDVTSALVYNQYLGPKNETVDDNGDSNDANTTTTGTQAYVDSQVYYIVVWLSETGTNQTVNNPAGTNTNNNIPTTNINFFSGTVTFNSAQGSEVTATFTDYTGVTPDTKTS